MCGKSHFKSYQRRGQGSFVKLSVAETPYSLHRRGKCRRRGIILFLGVPPRRARSRAAAETAAKLFRWASGNAREWHGNGVEFCFRAFLQQSPQAGGAPISPVHSAVFQPGLASDGQGKEVTLAGDDQTACLSPLCLQPAGLSHTRASVAIQARTFLSCLTINRNSSSRSGRSNQNRTPEAS